MLRIEYTDGRLPRGRTIEGIGPGRVHQMLVLGVPVRITDGADEYRAWCEDMKVGPLDASGAGRGAGACTGRGPGGRGAQEEAGAAAGDILPAGYAWEKRGSWYEVFAPDGSSLGKTQGEDNARDIARAHNADREADEPDADAEE